MIAWVCTGVGAEQCINTAQVYDVEVNLSSA